MTKEFFIGSKSSKENAKFFDEQLTSIIGSCLERGLGARIMTHLLVRHAAQLGFASTSSQMAVIFTIVSSILTEIERRTPTEYIGGKWINPNSVEDDEFSDFVNPEKMH